MAHAASKILSIEQAADVVRRAREAGETVVQCHGCFDIVHPGHIRHLRHARTFGSRLLVTVTADVVMAKGEGRPLIPQELRAENLAALDFVDWVAINDAPIAPPTTQSPPGSPLQRGQVPPMLALPDNVPVQPRPAASAPAAPPVQIPGPTAIN